MNYRISVVLPVYKSEKYIQNCLKSIVEQTYPPYEIILVSDGCVDKSIVIAKEYLDNLDIKFDIIEQSNQGVASARNNGISRANGDWVIAIDSDDCIYPHTFEILMNNVSDENVLAIDFATNQPREIEPIVTNEDIVSIDGIEAMNNYYGRKYKFVSPALMIKRSFLIENNIKYDVGCLFAEDDIYVWKILCKTNKLLYIKKPLYNYIFHSSSTMTTSNIDKFYSVKQFSEDLDSIYIQKSYNACDIKNLILYRHYIGLIHVAAKVQTYEDFKNLIVYYDMKELYNKRKNTFGFYNKIFFRLPLICPFLVYILFKYR